MDFDKRDIAQVDAGLVHIDSVLGDPPARHAEFLRDKHRRIGLLEREKFDFVELEGGLVFGTVERAVVAAHVQADRTFATGLHPHENTIVAGKVLTAGLAVAEEYLDAGIRVGIPLAELVVDNDGGVRTLHRDSRRAAVDGVRLGDNVGVIGEIEEHDVVETVTIGEQGYHGHKQQHKDQDVHPKEGVYLFHYL